jgi:hypothetical protein
MSIKYLYWNIWQKIVIEHICFKESVLSGGNDNNGNDDNGNDMKDNQNDNDDNQNGNDDLSLTHLSPFSRHPLDRTLSVHLDS